MQRNKKVCLIHREKEITDTVLNNLKEAEERLNIGNIDKGIEVLY